MFEHRVNLFFTDENCAKLILIAKITKPSVANIDPASITAATFATCLISTAQLPIGIYAFINFADNWYGRGGN